MKALASVLMAALGAAVVFISDIAIRARGLDGTHGINASSWDTIGTWMLVFGIAGFFWTVLFGD